MYYWINDNNDIAVKVITVLYYNYYINGQWMVIDFNNFVSKT